MRNIRRKVFESNSSSVHSLTFSSSGREESYLPMKDGYILTDFGQFDRSYRIYDDQESKLSYLVTLIYYASGLEYESVYNNDYFEMLQEAICKYTGAEGIKILCKKEPYIDHQSVPDYGDINIINMYDDDAIIDFVFNKYIALKTDCD